MLTTKYTYLYRLMGALGCGLVLMGMMLPYASVDAGKVGGFTAGTSASGWDLAMSSLNSGAMGGNVNPASAIFIALLMVMIFAAIGLFIMIMGRNGVSFGYFLISTTAFFLITVMVLVPYIQAGINVPASAFTTDKQAELDALNATDPEAGSRLYAQMMQVEEQRNSILEWKNLKMVPQIGCYICLVGSILAYVFAKLIVSDSAKVENYTKYAHLLGAVHKDGKVTTDEAGILTKERYLLHISKEEHEYIIRKTVEDKALQDRLIAMHEAPIDIEKYMRQREFDTYKRSMIQAWKDGILTKDEEALLKAEREGLGISDEDHESMYNELIERGMIKPGGVRESDVAGDDDTDDDEGIGMPKPTVIKGPAPPAPAPGGPGAPAGGPLSGLITAPVGGPAQPPKPGAPAAATDPFAKPPSGPMPMAPPQGPPVPPPAPGAPRPPVAGPPPPPQPIAGIPPATLGTAPGPGMQQPPQFPQQAPPPVPMPGPQAVPPPLPPPVMPGPPGAPGPVPPSVPGTQPAGDKVPIKTVRCSKCGSTIPIFTEDRPLQITCPGCKFSGTLKK
jgi:hypothetical protein